MFNFRGSPSTSFTDMLDKELLKYLSTPKDVMNYSRAVQEAKKRGLTNPKTGKPFQ